MVLDDEFYISFIHSFIHSAHTVYLALDAVGKADKKTNM